MRRTGHSHQCQFGWPPRVTANCNDRDSVFSGQPTIHAGSRVRGADPSRSLASGLTSSIHPATMPNQGRLSDAIPRDVCRVCALPMRRCGCHVSLDFRPLPLSRALTAVAHR